MSLRELAERAGTSHSAISAYETGRRTPTTTTLDRIARAAGFALDATLHRRICGPTTTVAPSSRRSSPWPRSSPPGTRPTRPARSSGADPSPPDDEPAPTGDDPDGTQDWADLERMAEAGTLDLESVIGVITTHLGAGDPRIERLRRLG